MTLEADLNDAHAVRKALDACKFTHVLHLAAQAGVRYAVKNPGSYVHSTVAGMVNLMEEINGRRPCTKVVPASSSSVYGLNTEVPFRRATPRIRRLALRATKKADELLAHTYNHIHGVAITALRFFNVYGPYGRPDMAYFSFANNIARASPSPSSKEKTMSPRGTSRNDDVVQSSPRWRRARRAERNGRIQTPVQGLQPGKQASGDCELSTIAEKHMGKRLNGVCADAKDGTCRSPTPTCRGRRDRVLAAHQPGRRLKKFVDWYKEFARGMRAGIQSYCWREIFAVLNIINTLELFAIGFSRDPTSFSVGKSPEKGSGRS